jgi:CheY-like chemotaxis protein
MADLQDDAALDDIDADQAPRFTHIMAAEDNALNRKILARYLRDRETVALSSDGQEAVDYFASPAGGNVQLIVMDCEMPRLDGRKATRKIREIEEGRMAEGGPSLRVPIIGLSGNARPEQIAQAKEVSWVAWHSTEKNYCPDLALSVRDGRLPFQALQQADLGGHDQKVGKDRSRAPEAGAIRMTVSGRLTARNDLLMTTLDRHRVSYNHNSAPSTVRPSTRYTLSSAMQTSFPPGMKQKFAQPSKSSPSARGKRLGKRPALSVEMETNAHFTKAHILPINVPYRFQTCRKGDQCGVTGHIAMLTHMDAVEAGQRIGTSVSRAKLAMTSLTLSPAGIDVAFDVQFDAIGGSCLPRRQSTLRP